MGAIVAVLLSTPLAGAPAPVTRAGEVQDSALVLREAPGFVGLPRHGDIDSCLVLFSGETRPLSAGARVFESKVIEAPHGFNALGFRLRGEVVGRWELDARASEDGTGWGEWLPADQLDAEAGETADTDLVFVQGRFVQYRLAVYDAPEDWDGRLDAVQVTFIDSTRGPTVQEMEASGGPLRRLAALIRPNVFSRSAWGANETYRTWPPQYAAPRKIIIHHTATQNSPPDAAAAIRAVYFYHAVTQAWGDIGYNFIIDGNGRVYEGRYGGPGVVGAHAAGFNSGTVGVSLLGNFAAAPPTEAALKAVESFIVSKAVQHGIDPSGQGVFLNKDLPNIFAHRDVNSTACPGEQMYAQLPGLRQRANAEMPLLGESWVQDNTPLLVDAGAQLTVRVSVRNSGRASWGTEPPNQMRIGFKWYKDGGLYSMEPGLEQHTDLPRNVHPGDSVTVDAVLRTPAQPGSYVLGWDMVQERVSWFYEQGNLQLEKAVVVGRLESLTNDVIMQLPNEFLAMLPAARLRSFPLSRLTLLSNTELVQLMPDIIPLFPNERVLSFSNDMLLRYLPDFRLKTFSLDRIRTFSEDVQVRLGLPPPSPTPPAGSPTPTPRLVTPTPISTPGATATPTPTPAADPGGGVAP